MMSTVCRTAVPSLTTLAAVLAAFIGLHAFAPQWVRGAGLDFWQASADEEMQQAEERRREIDTMCERLAHQIAAADAISAAVIENRMGLDDAVDRLAEINRDRPGFPDALRTGDSLHASERELWEHYLLNRVRSTLADDPSRQVEVLARLTCR